MVAYISTAFLKPILWIFVESAVLHWYVIANCLFLRSTYLMLTYVQCFYAGCAPSFS
jgi:hypothetical protein